MNVNDLNETPVAVNDSLVTNEDTPLVISAAALLANDTDVDRYSVTMASFLEPVHGHMVYHLERSSTSHPPAPSPQRS